MAYVLNACTGWHQAVLWSSTTNFKYFMFFRYFLSCYYVKWRFFSAVQPIPRLDICISKKVNKFFDSSLFSNQIWLTFLVLKTQNTLSLAQDQLFSKDLSNTSKGADNLLKSNCPMMWCTQGSYTPKTSCAFVCDIAGGHPSFNLLYSPQVYWYIHD